MFIDVCLFENVAENLEIVEDVVSMHNYCCSVTKFWNFYSACFPDAYSKDTGDNIETKAKQMVWTCVAPRLITKESN